MKVWITALALGMTVTLQATALSNMLQAPYSSSKNNTLQKDQIDIKVPAKLMTCIEVPAYSNRDAYTRAHFIANMKIDHKIPGTLFDHVTLQAVYYKGYKNRNGCKDLMRFVNSTADANGDVSAVLEVVSRIAQFDDKHHITERATVTFPDFDDNVRFHSKKEQHLGKN